MRDPLDVMVEVGLTEALAASRRAHARVQVSRPLRQLDGPAFDAAVEQFHRAYHTAYMQHPLYDRGEEAHDESTRMALEAFLGFYEETRR